MTLHIWTRTIVWLWEIITNGKCNSQHLPIQNRIDQRTLIHVEGFYNNSIPSH